MRYHIPDFQQRRKAAFLLTFALSVLVLVVSLLSGQPEQLFHDVVALFHGSEPIETTSVLE